MSAGRFEGNLPKLVLVEQTLDTRRIENIGSAVAEQFERCSATSAIKPGGSVALAFGSRGIDRINEVARAVVEEVSLRGGRPIIIPAMGSHEGATARGQRGALAKLGITEDTVGCPIRPSMKTVVLGYIRGNIPVHFSREALSADLVIATSRVKPHTSFTGFIESGVTKLSTVGLGKIDGAKAYHKPGYTNFPQNLANGLRVILNKVNMPFGIALVENGLSELAILEVVPGDKILERDQALLATATDLMPRLVGKEIDILVVGTIGKTISGRGMDTKVVRRDYEGPIPGTPQVRSIIVRDLVGNNANGIGAADIVLRQAERKINKKNTLLNAQTAGTPEGARIREIAENDQEALARACIALGISPEQARIVIIQDTKHLERMLVSETLLSQLQGGKTTIIEEPQAVIFDQEGLLMNRV